MQKIGVSLLAIVMITAGCGQSKKVADPFLSPPKPNNLTAKQTIYNTPAKMKAIEWTPYDIAITAVAAVAIVGGGYLWYQNYKQGQQIEDLGDAFRDFKKKEAKDIEDVQQTTSTSFALVAQENRKQQRQITEKLGKGEAAKTYAFKPVLSEEVEVEETERVEDKDVVKTKKIWKDRIVEIPEFVDKRTYSYDEQERMFLSKKDAEKLPFIPNSDADKFAPALHTHAQYQKKKKAIEQFVPKADIPNLPFAEKVHIHQSTDAQIAALQTELEKLQRGEHAQSENANHLAQEIQRLQQARGFSSSDSGSEEEDMPLNDASELNEPPKAPKQVDITPLVFRAKHKNIRWRSSVPRQKKVAESQTEQVEEVQVDESKATGKESLEDAIIETPAETDEEEQKQEPENKQDEQKENTENTDQS